MTVGNAKSNWQLQKFAGEKTLLWALQNVEDKATRASFNHPSFEKDTLRCRLSDRILGRVRKENERKEKSKPGEIYRLRSDQLLQ